MSKHKSQNTSDFIQQPLFGRLTSRISKIIFFTCECIINIKGKKYQYYVDIGKMSIVRKVLMNLLNGVAVTPFGLGCSHGGIKRHTLKKRAGVSD